MADEEEAKADAKAHEDAEAKAEAKADAEANEDAESDANVDANARSRSGLRPDTPNLAPSASRPDARTSTSTSTSTAPPPRAQRITFGAFFLVTALLVGVGVFGGLPTRWFPVDGVSGAIVGLFAAAGVSLLLGLRWAKMIARVACFFSLAIGMLVIALLASSAGYLRGAYGPVGQGGAIIFTFVIALVIPYLIALPSACLVWIGPRR
jgi:hypothetical protein